MPRYIDADKMIDGYSTTFPYNITYCDDGDLMEWINNQPTADVVPRSEIERLQEYYKRYIDRQKTIEELEEYIEHLENKLAKYEKEFDRLAWDSSPMGGFHDD